MAEEVKTTKTNKNYVMGIGRRREAIARVRIYNSASANVFGEERKRGDVVVNGKLIGEYFRITSFTSRYTKVLEDLGINGKYIISGRVSGGGLAGQLDAVILGIARAIDAIDSEKFHKKLRTAGYLTRDSRTRERRKVGTGGKARRKKQSPKR